MAKTMFENYLEEVKDTNECKSCSGLGDKKCSKCSGTGMAKGKQDVKSGSCDACKGDGTVPCGDCEGKGIVKKGVESTTKGSKTPEVKAAPKVTAKIDKE